MFWIGPLAVIVGALVCLSGFIIAKKPEAKHLFEKVAPFQGFLGVFLLAWGLYDLWHYVIRDWPPMDRSLFSVALEHETLTAVALLGYILSEIIIGFCLGFGLIANWIPGEHGAEKKGLEIQRKLLGFSIPIGIAGLVFAILWIINKPEGL